MPDLGFLEGQSPWLILAVVLIVAAAYVVTTAVKRSGDTGEGRQALESADAAADYLTEKAMEERDNRKRAEEQLKDARQELRDLTDEKMRLAGEKLQVDSKLLACQSRVRRLMSETGAEDEPEFADECFVEDDPSS